MDNKSMAHKSMVTDVGAAGPDSEEQPKVAPVDKKVKDTTKSAPVKKDQTAKPKAAESKTKVGENAQPSNAAKPKATAANASVEKTKNASTTEAAVTDAAKENNRGGKPRGKEYREKGGRGGRGSEGAEGERRPKRDFDRRSSTGRGRGEQSKGGRGAFGAGNPAQDAHDAEKDPNSAVVEGETVEEAAEPEEVAEPEPTTFTLDEFLEKRNEARKALQAQQTKERKVDQSALAGLSRKEDEGETTYMPVKASKADASRKDQRSTGKTQVLDVAFKFAAIQVDDDSRGGRGGRGDGRGRGEGGRGRGASNGGRGASRPAGSAPQGKAVFSTTDFPSL